jgi:hypothetical protein
VLGVVDLLRLLHRSVVEPQDHIAVVGGLVKGRSCDRDGLVGVVCEDGQRAGCVEADAADRVWVDVVLGDGTVDRRADAAPNVGRRLFLKEDDGSVDVFLVVLSLPLT